LVTDNGHWKQRGGAMGGVLLPEAGPPLLPTHDLTWDELESFLDGLLERLQRLPGAEPRLASSYRYGRRGDDQEGIDHYGTYDDGSTSTWQCRARESLGHEAVKEIFRETEVEADRHVIVFGRKASAAARKEMRGHPGWEIWDQRDLTNKVRSLPTHEARALLDAHFDGGVRRVVLPAADSDAFIGLDDHFGPLLTQGRIFHHQTDLLGRSDVLGQLSEALGPGAVPKVIVVTGSGGCGKSRVALEVLRSAIGMRPQRPVVVRNGTQSLSADAMRELRGLPVVVLVEDAQHDLPGLEAVLRYARHAAGAQLLATCRPSAVGAVREAALQAGFDSTEIRHAELKPLEPKVARDLVLRLVGASGLTLREEFVHVLAEAGRDCPLVPVVAVSMIASGTLKTTALSLNADFRQQILDRFGDVMRTGIPGLTSEQAGEILALFGALAPVRLDDGALLDAMGHFLGVFRDVLLERIQALIDHGVLLEHLSSIRVVPDILADEALLRAAVRLGRDSGYVDRLWAAFGNHAAGVLVRNLAELDWRVRSVGEGPDLFTRVWADIEREVITADAAGRRDGLSLLRDLAGPQSERVVDLVEVLISEPAVAAERSSGYHVTDDAVRAGLAPVLSICATTRAAVRGKALDLLWALASNDHKPANRHPDHPLRILADFAEFHRPGCSERQQALLEAAARWLRRPGADGDRVTPFAILEPLVAKEGMRTQRHPGGDALTLIPYLVSPAAVSDVRAGVRALATEHGKDADIRRAVAGVRLLESALAEPRGYFGSEVAEGHVRQWHDEDMATLDALAAVALETGEPVVRLEARDAASWIARYSGDEPLAERASSLIAAIDEHSEDLLSSVIIASFRDLVPRGAATLARNQKPPAAEEFTAAESRHSDEQRRVSLALWEQCPDAVAVAERLAERLRRAQDAGLRADGAGLVMEAVCAVRPEESEALVEAIRARGQDPTARLVHIPLETLRRRDERAFLRHLDFLLSGCDAAATAVIRGFIAYDWIARTPASGTRLDQALSHSSGPVQQMAIRAAGALLRQSPKQAVGRLLPLAPSNGDAVIDALGNAARHRFETWLDSLGSDEQEAVLRLLVAARQWAEWEAQHMFARLAARLPEVALDALVADVGEHGAIVESLDGLAEALEDHPGAISNTITYILGLEEQPRAALGYLLPSVLGSPTTAGSAKALKAAASTANASQLVRLAELLRHCESLVPSQPAVIEAMLERALEHGHSTHDEVRGLLLNSAVPAVDAGWGDGLPPKLAHLCAQAHKYAKYRDLSAATRDFYAAIISEG
jgi:hypothetical protein